MLSEFAPVGVGRADDAVVVALIDARRDDDVVVVDRVRDRVAALTRYELIDRCRSVASAIVGIDTNIVTVVVAVAVSLCRSIVVVDKVTLIVKRQQNFGPCCTIQCR